VSLVSFLQLKPQNDQTDVERWLAEHRPSPPINTFIPTPLREQGPARGVQRRRRTQENSLANRLRHVIFNAEGRKLSFQDVLDALATAHPEQKINPDVIRATLCQLVHRDKVLPVMENKRKCVGWYWDPSAPAPDK
jgi:hypothetical protein